MDVTPAATSSRHWTGPISAAAALAREAGRRLVGFEATAPAVVRGRHRRDAWGDLAWLAGRTLHSGTRTVRFEWEVPGEVLLAVYSEDGDSRPARHVRISLSCANGELEFSDRLGVPRGRGQVLENGTIWFVEFSSAQTPRRVTSGAVYSCPDADTFERQRFEESDGVVTLEEAQRYWGGEKLGARG